MMTEKQSNDKINDLLNGWTPWFRLATPFLIFLLGIVTTLVKMGVDDVRGRISVIEATAHFNRDKVLVVESKVLRNEKDIAEVKHYLRFATPLERERNRAN